MHCSLRHEPHLPLRDSLPVQPVSKMSSGARSQSQRFALGEVTIMAGSNIIRRLSRQTKLKQAKHDRRKVKHSSAPVLELPTPAQIEEIWSITLANMNIHVRSILETDCPESVPLMGNSMFETIKRFSDAGSRETLAKAILQCEEELEAILGIVMLSIAIAPVSTETTGH